MKVKEMLFVFSSPKALETYQGIMTLIEHYNMMPQNVVFLEEETDYSKYALVLGDQRPQKLGDVIFINLNGKKTDDIYDLVEEMKTALYKVA